MPWILSILFFFGIIAALIVCTIVLLVKVHRIKMRVADLEIVLCGKPFAMHKAVAPAETRPEGAEGAEPKEAAELEYDPSPIADTSAAGILAETPVKETIPTSEPKEAESIKAAEPVTEHKTGGTLAPLINFIKGGNIWVTAGLIFLVLGFAFSYLYISRNYNIPSEAKVAGGAVIGLALFIFAFLKRAVRPNFSLIMQGGGLGIMYLAFFAGYKIYKILPVEAALGLLIILIAAAGLMALLQNSEAMAFFSAVIGFAAPVLLSTGSNNYIALFSFYTVLNLCVLAAAFKKYWRYLNGVAFLCTYIVGVMWAREYYVPENFIDILIFSTAFFIIFTLVNFLCTAKTENRNIENVFAVATPFAYMATQLYIASHFQYGQAIAAFSTGIFYFILYTAINRFKAETYRPLAYLYLPFAVIFLNFSIPLALAGEWITAIWALEGAMLAVVGGYQKNRFFRFFGLILIFGAFRYEPSVDYFSTVFLNSDFVCRLLTAGAMLIAAGVFRIQKDWERKYLSYLILTIGIYLWYSTLFIEISNNAQPEYKDLFYLIICSVSGILIASAAKKLKWFLPQILAFSPVIAAVILSCNSLDWLFFVQAEDFYWAGWLVFILVQAALMYIYRDKAINKQIILTHALSLFFAVSLAGEALDYGFSRLLNFNEGETIFIHSVFLAAAFAVFVVALLNFNRPRAMLFGREIRFDEGYPKDVLSVWKVYGAGFITAYMIYFLFILGGSVYQMKLGTDYVKTFPVLNTSDGASLVMVIAALFYFARLFKTQQMPVKLRGTLKWIRGLAIFFWANALLGRAVFYLSDDEYYSFLWLMGSSAYQLAIAVLWGATGFIFIAYGFKKFRKTYWTIGAAVLAVDAVKLLLIDLSRVDTLQRILSFLGVGVIFIAIGYFFPLPRKLPEEEKAK
ncbi:MAG: DUF2339 domain-containing protein [Deferribacteraceae bacterium]|jgi:uncharacterized membrane protein|nr:DUF2339 domain-containing protein [Deferribacteraceae bacterium]